MAAGCGGWDEIEAWPLHRYRAMQRCWREIAPPPNVTLAAYVGFRPAPRVTAGGGDFAEGEAMLEQLRAMGVLA